MRSFRLTDEETELARKIRATTDKKELAGLNKKLGLMMERRHSLPLLESAGFSRILPLNRGEHTDPDVSDFTAQRNGRNYVIRIESMSDVTSKLGIDIEAIEVLAEVRQTRDDSVALLTLGVSEESNSVGNAVLLTIE